MDSNFLAAFVHSAWAYALVPSAIALAWVYAFVNSTLQRRKLELEIAELKKRGGSALHLPTAAEVERFGAKDLAAFRRSARRGEFVAKMTFPLGLIVKFVALCATAIGVVQLLRLLIHAPTP